jgi:hypothetical protein
VALDEDDADDMLLIPGYEDSVITDEHAHGRLIRDGAKLHGFEDDRIPAVVTDPLRFSTTTLGGIRIPIEDGHDSIVAQDAFYSAVCHGYSLRG